MNRILKVKSILFPSLGLICILFSDRVTLAVLLQMGAERDNAKIPNTW